jgi:hypothetical protein
MDERSAGEGVSKVGERHWQSVPRQAFDNKADCWFDSADVVKERRQDAGRWYKGTETSGRRPNKPRGPNWKDFRLRATLYVTVVGKKGVASVTWR